MAEEKARFVFMAFASGFRGGGIENPPHQPM
jgi:hypothetical protein